MTTTYLYIFASVLIVSLISFVGIFTLSVKPDKLKRYTMFLVALSAGTLLGDAFIHLMPEAIESNDGQSVWLWLVAGILVFFVLEKIICWRHCHLPTSSSHPHPLGMMNIVGDSLHNFLDGMVIGGTFLVSIPLGIATSLAVFAHEIPQEIGDFGVLLHAGYSRVKALKLNFLIALDAFAGALGAIIIGASLLDFQKYILPFTAGGFIYIATADLIPELKKDTGLRKSLTQLGSILLGLAIMILMKYLVE